MSSIKNTDLIYRYLDTNGDGTGTKNANGDYSASAADQDFYYEAAKPTRINRIIISVSDANGGTSAEYGNTGGALGNGYYLRALDASDNVLCDFNDGVPITTNGNLGRMCYDVDMKTWGTGQEILLARFTFEKCGYPLILETGEKLVVNLSDDLSGLVDHYFMIQGYLIDSPKDYPNP